LSPPDNSQYKIKNEKLFVTANRYEILTQNEHSNILTDIPTSETPIIEEQIKPPPPIFVKGIINFSGLYTTLIEPIGVDNFLCKSLSDYIKIQTANPDSYRTLIHFSKDQKAQYHTYQLKEDKPTRAIIRIPHPSTPIDIIKSELELRFFEVRKVTNVLHKTSKCPMPLFFIDLEPTDTSNDIFKLSSLLHT
jgi:hypothetical protein